MEHAGCDASVQRCPCGVLDNLVSQSLCRRILPAVVELVPDALTSGAAPVQRECGSAGERAYANCARLARYSAKSFTALLLRFKAASDLLSARPDEAKRALETTIDQAAQAVIEGRDAVQQLRSTTPITNDLVDAIGSLGKVLATNGSNGDVPAFHVEVQGTARDLFPITRDEAYRIAGEALRNAFQHARARHLEVEVRYDTRQLRLRIRDDGKGIDPQFLRADEPTGHYGLRGMR